MLFHCLEKYNTAPAQHINTHSHTDRFNTNVHPSVNSSSSKSSSNTNCKHVELNCLYTLAFYIPFVKIPTIAIILKRQTRWLYVTVTYSRTVRSLPSPIFFGNHYKMGTDDFYVRLRCCSALMCYLAFVAALLFCCLFYTSFGRTHKNKIPNETMVWIVKLNVFEHDKCFVNSFPENLISSWI